MKRCASLVLGLFLVATAVAQDKPKGDDAKKGDLKDPITILKKADAVTKAAKSVRYEGTFKPTGDSAASAPTITGSVVLAGRSSSAQRTPQKFRIEAKVKMPSGETREFTVGSDGENYFLIDPKTKMVHVDIDSAVIGRTAGQARFLTMLEYVYYPSPFGDEIKGDKREMRDSVKIGDEECYQIHVVYAGGQGESTWYFSKKDFLPRQVDRMGRQPFSLMLEKVAVDPKFVKNPFEPEVPEGYTKTDEPAP